jgi:hypothetical protein
MEIPFTNGKPNYFYFSLQFLEIAQNEGNQHLNISFIRHFSIHCIRIYYSICL